MANIGIDENNHVLLLDIETAAGMAPELVDFSWDSGQKARASIEIKTFFTGLKATLSISQALDASFYKVTLTTVVQASREEGCYPIRS